MKRRNISLTIPYNQGMTEQIIFNSKSKAKRIILVYFY